MCEYRSSARGEGRLPHVARVAERIAPRLRPYGEAVRHAADGNRLHRAVVGVEGIDDAVVATREPKPFAVGAQIPHVGASPSRNRPGRDHFAGGEVEHRDAALAVLDPGDVMRAAIGDIELGSIAARIEAVRADAGRNEPELPEYIAVDDDKPVPQHVGDE